MEDLQALRSIFQKVQDSVTSHKLSDRNCIEIINKLTSLGLLEVIYTTDGREYLTPQQLEREIRDEVVVNGGKLLAHSQMRSKSGKQETLCILKAYNFVA